MIAVTGMDAEAVQRLAAQFEERIGLLEKMGAGEAKELEVKAIQAELNSIQISTLTKKKLQERFNKVYQAQLDQQKAAQKAEGKKALDVVQAYFKTNEHATSLVTKLDISANSKAVGETLNYFKTKDQGKSVYLFAADGDKVVHGCHISEVSKPQSKRDHSLLTERSRNIRMLSKPVGPLLSGQIAFLSSLAAKLAARALRLLAMVQSQVVWTRPFWPHRSTWLV